jgi:hypothetical protein
LNRVGDRFFKLFIRCGFLLRHSLSLAVALLLVGFVVGSVASSFAGLARPKENVNIPATFQPEVRKHVSPTRPEEPADMNPLQTPAGELALAQAVLTRVVMATTRRSFLATGNRYGATGFLIDISTNPSFNNYVNGYKDSDICNVTSRIVSRLSPGTKYYYRVRSYNSAGTGSRLEIGTAATTTVSGLVINPTFDSSITSNSNSAAIESMITQSIALYQSLFGDSVTVEMLFRYANTEPDGTPITGTAIAESLYVVYHIPWATYISSLTADAKTTNDTGANASLPSASLTPNLVPSSANGRAVGFDTPPAMFANGTVAVGGPYTGNVTINSKQPYQLTRPTSTAIMTPSVSRSTKWTRSSAWDHSWVGLRRRPTFVHRICSVGRLPAPAAMSPSAHATSRSTMETPTLSVSIKTRTAISGTG